MPEGSFVIAIPERGGGNSNIDMGSYLLYKVVVPEKRSNYQIMLDNSCFMC